MKKKLVVVLLSAAMCVAAFGGCGAKSDSSDSSSNKKTETSSKKEDQKAADAVAKKIDAIYVQERTDKTDEQCKAAKEAWDKLTDAQKELVEGDNADPDYFGRDTGDASQDDPLNGDDIGEKELGYTNGEISRLYIMSTMLVVIIELLISLPIEKAVMNVIFRAMMMSSMTGWITLWIDPKIYVEMFLVGFITYVAVALLEYRKIKKVPMDEALKNVE